MKNQNTVLRLGKLGALINIAGIVLSGPIGLALILLLHPTPAWDTPTLWAETYHPIKTLPFFFGFLLVGGYILMMAAAHELAEEQDRVYTSIALLFTSGFVTLIFFNYISQTTFMPALARNYRPEYDALISGFSFDNPLSLSWAIEMWGYALLGVATIFAARIFTRNRTEKITAYLMIANGVISVLGALVAAANLGWVMTLPGLISYNAWNALVFALAVFFYLSLRKRMVEESQSHLLNKKATPGLELFQKMYRVMLEGTAQPPRVRVSF